MYVSSWRFWRSIFCRWRFCLDTVPELVYRTWCHYNELYTCDAFWQHKTVIDAFDICENGLRCTNTCTLSSIEPNILSECFERSRKLPVKRVRQDIAWWEVIARAVIRTTALCAVTSSSAALGSVGEDCVACCGSAPPRLARQWASDKRYFTLGSIALLW